MRKTATVVMILALPGVLGLGVALGAPVINEFVRNHTGTDSHEFIEIKGDPNTDYSSLTIVEIEGDGFNAGVIDDAFTVVGTTNADGYWCIFLANVVENGTVTLLLVDGYSGTVGDDVDTDNDGTVDAAAWTSIIDAIAVTDGGASDFTYANVTLAPDFDGGSSSAGGASRIPDGTDTESTADWVRNDFEGAGLPGFPTDTVDPGEAGNTPCSQNMVGIVPVKNSTFGRIKTVYQN